MPPTSSPSISHSPVCRPIRTVSPSGSRPCTIACAQRTACDGAPANDDEERVADRLDLAAAEAVDLAADDRVVGHEQVAPAGVAEPGGVAGRADDVAEQDRQQLALRRAAPAAGEELLDLAEQRGAVADARQVVDALELDVPRAGDVLGDVARVAHVDQAVAHAVEDQRRHAEVGELGADVEVGRAAAPPGAARRGSTTGAPAARATPAAARRRPGSGRSRRASRRCPSARPCGRTRPSARRRRWPSRSPARTASARRPRRARARARARGGRRRP